MFFVLSKTLSLLAIPSNLLILIGLAGCALLPTRWSRLGRRLAAASIVLLAVLGFAPVGSLLAGTLENRFPAWSPSGAPLSGIIVLGGAIDPDASAERGEPVIGQSVQRLTVLRKLARELPALPIVYSGGNGSLAGGPSEADVALTVLQDLGIPRERIVLERQSRNTAENATFSAELLKPQPGQHWLLVTSAQHMPRAVGCFRRAGFNVEAYPVTFQTAPGLTGFASTLAAGLGHLDGASREWIGLVAYWLTGRTSALFPAPES